MIIGVGFQFYSNLFQLIELAGFAFSLIAALAVLGLLYLRYKDPDLKTDFQLPIFFPILFLFCDVFILCLTAYQQPKESLSNIILMLSAIPIYLVFVSWKRKPRKFTDFMYKSTICLQKVFASVPVDDVEEAEADA
nr:unnamed protein product [Spirometra erinaceieuropaei]